MPESDPNPKPPSDGTRDHFMIEGRIVQQGSKHLYAAGIVVFLASSVICVAFLMFTSHNGMLEDWVRLRTVQLFAMIAAVGIVVAIIANSTNAFVTVFGILLIGALIVPTKDMVALALLASGRDSAADDEDRVIEDGAEYKGRATDLANKIVSSLEDAPRQSGSQSGPRVIGSLDPSERSQAILAVERALDEERRISSLDRARLGGYMPLLMSFAPDFEEGESIEEGSNAGEFRETTANTRGNFQQYYFRHGIDSNFVNDLLELRRQELVQFSYSELSDANITYLGKEVVCEYFRVVENDINKCLFRDVVDSYNEISSQLSLPDSFSQRAQEFCESALYDQVPLIEDYPWSQSQRVQFAARIILDSSTPNEMEVILSKYSEGDPVVSIFRRILRPNEVTCNFVVSNDDGNFAGHTNFNDLDSRLTLAPQPDEWGTEYLIVADDLSAGTPEMRLTVAELQVEEGAPDNDPSGRNVAPLEQSGSENQTNDAE